MQFTVRHLEVISEVGVTPDRFNVNIYRLGLLIMPIEKMHY